MLDLVMNKRGRGRGLKILLPAFPRPAFTG
jgi:hypothetical protein